MKTHSLLVVAGVATLALASACQLAMDFDRSPLQDEPRADSGADAADGSPIGDDGAAPDGSDDAGANDGSPSDGATPDGASPDGSTGGDAAPTDDGGDAAPDDGGSDAPTSD